MRRFRRNTTCNMPGGHSRRFLDIPHETAWKWRGSKTRNI